MDQITAVRFRNPVNIGDSASWVLGMWARARLATTTTKTGAASLETEIYSGAGRKISNKIDLSKLCLSNFGTRPPYPRFRGWHKRI
jgi:hypothetical protein